MFERIKGDIILAILKYKSAHLVLKEVNFHFIYLKTFLCSKMSIKYKNIFIIMFYTSVIYAKALKLTYMFFKYYLIVFFKFLLLFSSYLILF